MSNQDLTAAVREFQEYKRIKEEADTAMKAAQGKIIAHMMQQGIAEMTVDIHKVSYKPVVSARLNTSALKEANPNLFAQFSTTSTSMRFIIT